MKGFGVHTSMWTMAWDRPGAERAVSACKALGFDFIEIALLSPDKVDTAHSRALLERASARWACPRAGAPPPTPRLPSPSCAMRWTSAPPSGQRP